MDILRENGIVFHNTYHRIFWENIMKGYKRLYLRDLDGTLFFKFIQN